MGNVTGVVKAKSKKSAYGTYGINVNDKWYNSKYEIKAEKGDEVTFDDGDKNYCSKLKVVSSGGGVPSASTGSGGGGSSRPNYSRGKFPIDPGDGQRSIIRQNALTNAIKAVELSGEVPSELNDIIPMIIDTARNFESYTAGDLDREAAKQLGDSFNPED